MSHCENGSWLPLALNIEGALDRSDECGAAYVDLPVSIGSSELVARVDVVSAVEEDVGRTDGREGALLAATGLIVAPLASVSFLHGERCLILADPPRRLGGLASDLR